MKNGKKRKLSSGKLSRLERFQNESKERYGKLHHTSSKHLHREAKVVKSFECQKIVRAIKLAKESLPSRDSPVGDRANENNFIPYNDFKKKEATREKTEKVLARVRNLEIKLEKTKKFNLNILVGVSLKRLGVLNLDPKIAEGTPDHSEKPSNVGVKDSTDGISPSSDEPSSDKLQDLQSSLQTEDTFCKKLLESMLQHKRLSTAMDQLNEKVTEYRRWLMFQQEILLGDDILGSFKDFDGAGMKKKKKKNHNFDKALRKNETMIVAGGAAGGRKRYRCSDLGGHEGTSGLFIGSLSGIFAEREDDVYDGAGEMNSGYENDDMNFYDNEEKKKNRPGQRSRKAKAMAIKARKAGKTWDSSINWRESKKEHKDNKKLNNRVRNHSIDQESRRVVDSIQGNSYEHDGKGKRCAPRAKENQNAQRIGTMGKTWKEEGQAHPSWAAAQKSHSIAKFQGKKITFD